MRRTYLFAALVLSCLQLITVAATGQKPRPRPDVRREPGRAVPAEKKWERGQRTDEFRRAVEGRSEEKRRTDRESRPSGGVRIVEKAHRWDRGQRKGEFKRAVEGEVVERKRTDRDQQSSGGRRHVEKAEWWERRNQIKDGFNKVANPKNPPDGGGNGGSGGKGGGNGGSAPPAAPAPKPPQP